MYLKPVKETLKADYKYITNYETLYIKRFKNYFSRLVYVVRTDIYMKSTRKNLVKR